MRNAAARPPEERGLTRDRVRLLAATPDGLAHATFGEIGHFMCPGDVLVVNTSATIAAAVDGSRADGRLVTAHFSTPLDDGTWLIELRQNSAEHERVRDAYPDEIITLPSGAALTLLHRYPEPDSDRLWTALVTTGLVTTGPVTTGPVTTGPVTTGPVTSEGAVDDYLARHGRPIRYSYVPDPWPLTAYQTVFSRDRGSAEMPSAGRPFTGDLVGRLIAAGVIFAPITLHAGVASLESHEAPLPERFTVPEPTARLVNLARNSGNRVVAVGTTSTRALESAADDSGMVHAAGGWTDLVLGPDRPSRVVNGLVTGWHDPEASHLALLQAVAGSGLVRAAYAEAERADYLWHEFGDSCLLLPPAR